MDTESIMDVFQRRPTEEILTETDLKEVIETGTLNGDPVATNTRIKECNNIIDRYIGKPTQTVKTQSMNVHFTVEEIKEMQDRAKEQMKHVS